MARVMLEPLAERPAWAVRVEGQRVGVAWRERGMFRALREGESEPLATKFRSREAAAKALARRAGFEDLDQTVAVEDPRS
ncbi:MAG: hypothetical protein ACRDJP_11235 [Actinomycetota bacterium]